MAWSKVKNIILLMLVCTNLLLLFFVASPQAQSELNEDASRQSALSILGNRGIAVDERIVPQDIYITSQSILPSRDDESTLATNLLGSVSISDLGGDVLLYENESGSIRFHTGGEFSGTFSPSIYPTGTTMPQEQGTYILSQLVLDCHLDTIVEGTDTTTLIYTQLWDGVPLLDYGVTFLFEGDILTQVVDGKRLYGTAVQQESQSLSVSTALMQFVVGLQELGDVCRTINGITSAYSASLDLSGYVQLTPLWCIETDTGAYQLNLVSGELSRV